MTVHPEYAVIGSDTVSDPVEHVSVYFGVSCWVHPMPTALLPAGFVGEGKGDQKHLWLLGWVLARV